MSALAETILAAVQALPEGGLLSAKDFLHAGARAVVNRSLSRLTREGRLLRLERGAYVAPIISRFGVRAPSTWAVIAALKATGEVIVTHPAVVANALGLTTQVPVREVFLTSGRSRKLQFGNRTVELRHAGIPDLSDVESLARKRFPSAGDS